VGSTIDTYRFRKLRLFLANHPGEPSFLSKASLRRVTQSFKILAVSTTPQDSKCNPFSGSSILTSAWITPFLLSPHQEA
jgi:hypothetical protein